MVDNIKLDPLYIFEYIKVFVHDIKLFDTIKLSYMLLLIFKSLESSACIPKLATLVGSVGSNKIGEIELKLLFFIVTDSVFSPREIAAPETFEI